jgi:hypothetical protein
VIEHALSALAHGWAVFPLAFRGKEPLLRRGVYRASRAEAAIRRWWATWPRANVGIATGTPSGIWILDVDGEAGRASVAGLVAEHGSIPETRTVRTGHGFQAYFLLPDGIRIGNTCGTIAPGIDTRGEGGYGIGVGSVHPTGRIYRLARDRPVVAAPASR